MKATVFSVILTTMILQACTGFQKDTIRTFIPGKYVRKIQNEFTDGWDTLVIKEQDHSAGVYFIDKMEGYQKHIDGRTFKPEHKTQEWTAVYDEKLHQLVVQNQECNLLFDVEKRQLIMNRTVYDKAKD